MILFQKVRWKNFLSTGNVYTELSLNENKTTLIVGENGAGKSTFLEALSYGLYGKAFRNVNKPQLINSITGKHMVVEIELVIGNKEYLIRRGMKPNLFEVYQNGVLISQDAASRDYQEALEQNILKMNHKSFCQVVMLGMANFTPFMELPAASRRQVIEDLLDIQIFSVMNTLLKDRVQTNKSELANNEYNSKLVQSKLQMHAKHVAELQANNEELISERQKQIATYETEMDNATASRSRVVQEIQQLQSQIAGQESVQGKLSKLSDLRRQLLSKSKNVAKQIDFYSESANCPTCQQEIAEDFKVATLSSKRALVEEIEQALSTLEEQHKHLALRLEQYAKVNADISERNAKVTELNVEIQTKTQFIDGLRAEVVALQNKAKAIVAEDNTRVLLEAEAAKLNQTREELIKAREVLNYASQLLKDGGIKSRIIKQYIPIMNKLINKYLAALDFYVQFEIDEEFKETIKSRFRDEFTYASFSQGERLRIDLALMFTWRAIAKLRNSASTNLLVMDEILDSSLDMAGVDEFIKIIKTLTADTNTFIISHKGDQMIDKFNSIVRFEKYGNFSRIAA